MGSSGTIQDGSRWLSRSQRRAPTAAAAAADLMACFPTRAPLMRIMPKPVCSPSRPMDNPKRGRAPCSRPMFKTKIKPKGNNGSGSGSGNAADMEEPTSPKVTCAGQIRIKPRARACKSWQTVMEEIERLHSRKRGKARWLEPLRIKKEIMHFLAALRDLRLDFRCFGAVPMVASSSSSSSSASEEDDDDEAGGGGGANGDDEDEKEENSRAAFAQWSMMMQRSSSTNRLEKERRKRELEEGDDQNAEDGGAVPPKNALLLMRCRSAPAQGLQSRSYEEEEANNEDQGGEREQERIILSRYAPDFYMLSSDIAKETWVRKSDFLQRSSTLKR